MGAGERFDHDCAFIWNLVGESCPSQTSGVIEVASQWSEGRSSQWTSYSQIPSRSRPAPFPEYLRTPCPVPQTHGSKSASP